MRTKIIPVVISSDFHDNPTRFPRSQGLNHDILRAKRVQGGGNIHRRREYAGEVLQRQPPHLSGTAAQAISDFSV